jgi:hypothetical protein
MFLVWRRIIFDEKAQVDRLGASDVLQGGMFKTLATDADMSKKTKVRKDPQFKSSCMTRCFRCFFETEAERERKAEEAEQRRATVAAAKAKKQATAATAQAASSSAPPRFLHVSAPKKDVGCAGKYVLSDGLRANGQPVWRKSGDDERWLYTGIKGKWCIADKKAKEKKFKCSIGWIASAEPHGGVEPHMVTAWKSHDGKAWILDPGVNIKAEASDDDTSFFRSGRNPLTGSPKAGAETSEVGPPPRKGQKEKNPTSDESTALVVRGRANKVAPARY